MVLFQMWVCLRSQHLVNSGKSYCRKSDRCLCMFLHWIYDQCYSESLSFSFFLFNDLRCLKFIKDSLSYIFMTEKTWHTMKLIIPYSCIEFLNYFTHLIYFIFFMDVLELRSFKELTAISMKPVQIVTNVLLSCTFFEHSLYIILSSNF